MKQPPLRAFRTENFKAIRDSGTIRFGWLTLFIGSNGSGKSSLVEALETFRGVVLDGVDSAFERWRGFEHVLNKSRDRKLLERVDRPGYSHPMKFRLHWKTPGREFEFQQAITQGPGGNTLFVQQEQIVQRRPDRREFWTRNENGEVLLRGGRPGQEKPTLATVPKRGDGQSLLNQFAWECFEPWRFLMLNPERMGQPKAQQRASNGVRLDRDGSNVAQYLQEIRDIDVAAFEGILAALHYVLPYVADLQPTLTSELERAFYLKLKEEAFEVPGWLLSTGTLRIVALLACLRHPKPPPVLIVEEIENGLDPRTLHLLVEEIRAAITAGTTQVILTTHSPYLLDLLDLSHIVVVEREDGQPVFRRPDAEQLAEWAKSFSPGRLYTMGRLTRGER